MPKSLKQEIFLMRSILRNQSIETYPRCLLTLCHKKRHLTKQASKQEAGVLNSFSGGILHLRLKLCAELACPITRKGSSFQSIACNLLAY